MSRSGYSEDFGDNPWDMIMWRGAVAAAIRGKRGQAFLREMLVALDALPEKKLIVNELEQEGYVCAIGAVGKTRGIAMQDLDPDDSDRIAKIFGIAPALAKELVWMNDELFDRDSPDVRFVNMRQKIQEMIR